MSLENVYRVVRGEPLVLRDTASAMSEKSTIPDLVGRQKRLTKAASRRDLDALMALYASDVVYDMSPMGMGTFEGWEAVRGFVDDWSEDSKFARVTNYPDIDEARAAAERLAEVRE
jgi:ketosteroid isomerase-like protein